MRKARAPWRTAIHIRQGACWLYLWEGGCEPLLVRGANQ